MREATVEDPDLSMNAMAHRIRPQVKVVPDNCEARSSRPASTPARCLARRSAMRPDQGTGGGELEVETGQRDHVGRVGPFARELDSRPALVAAFIDDHRKRFGSSRSVQLTTCPILAFPSTAPSTPDPPLSQTRRMWPRACRVRAAGCVAR